jgi:hypothetical protein
MVQDVAFEVLRVPLCHGMVVKRLDDHVRLRARILLQKVLEEYK